MAHCGEAAADKAAPESGATIVPDPGRPAAAAYLDLWERFLRDMAVHGAAPASRSG